MDNPVPQTSPTQGKSDLWKGLLIALGVTLVICLLCTLVTVVNMGAPLVAMVLSPTRTPVPIVSEFAQQELAIHETDKKQDLLNYPRYVGLDGQGNIYVGNAGSGNISIFDASGTFQRAIPVLGKGSSMNGMAVAPDGTIYLSADGGLRRIDPQGSTTSLPYDSSVLGTSKLSEIVLDKDGSLLATDEYGNILRFQQDGTVQVLMLHPFETYLGDTEHWLHINVDSAGNIYALGETTSFILKLSPDGKLLGQFGGETHHHVVRDLNDPPGAVPSMDPGYFYQPEAIAVDQYGRMFVSDNTYNVQILDANGKFVASLDTSDVLMWLIFDANNNLYASSDAPEVIKLAVKRP